MCRKIVERFGESPKTLWEIATNLHVLAHLEPDLARTHLEEARDTMHAMIDRDWADAEQRTRLDAIEQALADLSSDQDCTALDPDEA